MMDVNSLHKSLLLLWRCNPGAVQALTIRVGVALKKNEVIKTVLILVVINSIYFFAADTELSFTEKMVMEKGNPHT